VISSATIDSARSSCSSLMASGGMMSSVEVWADGSAKTLKQVLTANPNDRHGQLTAGLTSAQIDQLVAYLQSL